MSENKVFYLEYACYICGDILSGPKTTIDHVRRVHSYDIPTRAVGHKRPQNQDYQYVKNKNEQHDTEEYACPSCWFHCPKGDFPSLTEHTVKQHDPIKVDTATNNSEDSYVIADEASSFDRNGTTGRRGSEQPPTTNGNSLDTTTAAEISHKIDEVINLFKKLFE